MLNRYPWLKEVLQQNGNNPTGDPIQVKSKGESTEERVIENEKTLRMQRVRQLIDDYTENNQMPLHKGSLGRREASTINGSFGGKKGREKALESIG